MYIYLYILYTYYVHSIDILCTSLKSFLLAKLTLHKPTACSRTAGYYLNKLNLHFPRFPPVTKCCNKWSKVFFAFWYSCSVSVPSEGNCRIWIMSTFKSRSSSCGCGCSSSMMSLFSKIVIIVSLLKMNNNKLYRTNIDHNPCTGKLSQKKTDHEEASGLGSIFLWMN